MENNVEYYPLTHPQKAVWFTEKLHPDTSIGNIAGTLRIKGGVDFLILEKAINIFIEKNNSMRLRILEINGEPKQYLSKNAYRKLDYFDFSEKDINELYKWDAFQTKTPFKLIDSDLFYFALIKISDSDCGFYVKCHHLISDAWSMSLLGSQIMSHYSILKKGNEISVSNNPSYIDYIISEEEYKNSDRFSRDKEYWNKVFDLLPEKTVLKKADSDNVSIKARRKTMLTPKKLTAKIYQYCAESKISVFSLFIAALSMYINRVTAKEDIILGTTTLNRLNSKEKETAGMFDNITPMRININDEMNFESLIDGVSKEGIRLLRHQKYPYDLILKGVREKHKISENIFNIILIYQNSKFSKDNLDEKYSTRWHFNGYQVDSLHISINDRENEGHLIIDYDYQIDLFHAKEIDFIHQNIINVLWHALDDPAKKISQLAMLSEKERYKILNEFNRTKIIYPEGYTKAFEELDNKIPEKAKCYILDKNLNLLPIGVAGQLYISGSKLTAKKIKALGLSEKMAIPNPYSSEDILYKSGCIARWFPDGDIMYLGSADAFIPKGSSDESRKQEEINVDILSTFTAEPVESYIKWWGEKFGYNLKIGFAGYNQVFQELLNPNSMLSKNIKGINVALVRFEDFIRFDNGTDESKISILERTFEELKEAFDRFGNEIPFIIAVFPISTHLGLSIALQQKITKINADFVKIFSKHKNIIILDFNELQVLYGIQEAFDPLKDREGHMPFTEEYYAAMGTEVARKICAVKRQNFKVIVLDCDNTLWKGICGEQGSLGVQITEPFRQLQQFMLQKYEEGMLLAVCSKNNEKDVFEVFENNSEMVLNKKHIISWKVNWKEKSANIIEIANELNLSLDSFIFIDDNPLECSKMVESYPEVLTLQLPSEDEYIPLFLKHVWAFDRVRVTNEDVLRNSMYEAEKKRTEFRKENVSLLSFMKNLQLKVSMRAIEESEIERAAQLTQRTNQFNLSTIRRNEDEIAQLLKDKDSECFVVEASDKFGDYGIIGLVILKISGEKLFLDTFLMSCRIFGRNVEDVILAGIGKYARETGCYSITATFIPTEKNMPVHDFIKRMKWVLIEETEKQQQYGINIQDLPENVEHIEFYYRKMYERSTKNIENIEVKFSNFYSYYKLNKFKQKDKLDIAELQSYNIENLMLSKHNNYILPLYYLNAQKLLCIPVYKSNNENNIQLPSNEKETYIEKRLLKVWKDVLKIENIEVDSDFFEIGGDSLSAVILISKIFKEFCIELTLKDLFVANSIRKLAKKLVILNKSVFGEIVPVTKKSFYIASSSQKRIYILNEIGKSTIYNMPIIVLLQGNVDILKLEGVFKKIIDNHESFRTSFHIVDGVLMQKIHEKVDFCIEKQNDIIEQYNIMNYVKPFEIDKAPLLRVKLFGVDKNKMLMLIDMHHIISDGVSLKIFFDELIALYRGEVLGEVKIQYKDYAEWEVKRINGNALNQQKEYWSKVYNNNIPLLNMPLNFKREEKQAFNGNVIEFIISKKEIYGLKNICDNISLNAIIFTLYTILLNKYTNQDDIVIGSIVAGRTHAGVDKLIGNFTNFLPIRNRINTKMSYLNNLYSITENLTEAYQNQEYPFEKIIEDTGVQFNMSRNPMFDTAIVFHNEFESNILSKKVELENGLGLELYDIISINSTIDIKLDVFMQENDLKCLFQYNKNLYTSNTINNLIYNLHKLIDAIIKNPHETIENINILNNDEFGKSDYIKSADEAKSIQINKNIKTDIEPNNRIYKTESILESQIVNLFRDVMKKPYISVYDNIFKIGGDSLTAVIIISRVAKEFNVELSVNDIFVDNTAQKLANKIIDLKRTEHHEIELVPHKEYYELTSAQKRMYLISQVGKNKTVYNECHKIEIKGYIDKYKLTAAFKEIIRRHEILRTGFENINGNLVQKVYKDIDFKVNYIKPYKNEIQSIISGFVKAFDLSTPPLIRVTLLEIGGASYILLLDIHHIIVDGTSMGIFLKELFTIYENKPLSPLKLQYKDFAHWQNQQSESPILEKQEMYWIEQFETDIPILNLPTDYNRPTKKSYDGEKEYFTLDSTLVEKLNAACGKTGTTLFMVLFAAFSVLLSKYTGQQDIVVGTPVTGRSNIDAKDIIGMFVNSLPIRTKPYGHIYFCDYLNAVKDVVLNSLKNQDYQYDMMIEKLKISQDRSRNPLFDVMFAFQNIDIPDLVLDGMEIKQCKYGNKCSKFDLFISAVKKGKELFFELEYSTELFKTETIKRMIGHFLNIINEILNDPKKLISNIDMLGLEEKGNIVKFNETHVNSKILTIQQSFEEQVNKTPNRIAVKFEGKQLTYKELNAKANQLARVLRSRGVKNDYVVGIMIDRSIDLVIGILGIIKSGGAYLPIDPNYPKERIKYILKDSGARTLITTQNLISDVVLDQDKILFTDAYICKEDTSNVKNTNTLNDLLYVVYTSGTTGKPKGVMIEHKNLANLIMHQLTKNDINYECNVMQFASMSFDVYSQELFSTLFAGGTLNIISNEDKKSVINMYNFIKESNISIMYLPTAFFKFIINNMIYLSFAPECVKHIIVAGEKLTLTPNFKQYLNLSGISLHNHYGPAETHVVTTYTIKSEEDFSEVPYIGKPISNTQIYILDNNLKIQPIGVYGEIYITGESVGRGYIGNDLLTSEKFITINILGNQIRAYKTGDIGRWTKDGNIDFLGRVDNQVKIRGYRIELEEIETYFRKHDKIKECAILLQNISTDRKELVAYYTASSTTIISDLKKFLKEFLPVYMIPKYFIQINEMPLNQNGKINKDLLQTYFVKGNRIEVIDKPTNKEEKILIDILKVILDTNDIGINDDFFDIGGDSLLSIKVVLEASKKGLKFSINDLYTYPTVKELCKNILGDNYSEVV